jgi:hypothetical protein
MVFFPTFSTFILMFWLSLSGQLSLPGIYTWRGTQQLSPWDNNQAIKPFPSLGGHSTHHQQGVPPLLLQQHPTPLSHLQTGTTCAQAPCIAPRQEFPVLRQLAPVMPVLPPPGALPVFTPPFLGPAPPPLCFNP